MIVENGQFDNNIILNSEGVILKIVELKQEDEEFGKPYLSVLCNKNVKNIYTRTNKTILTLYFQGRVTIKELFLINLDKPYYVENNDEITKIEYSDDFHNNYIENIESKDMIFYAMPRDIRIEDPFENIMRYWDVFY